MGSTEPETPRPRRGTGWWVNWSMGWVLGASEFLFADYMTVCKELQHERRSHFSVLRLSPTRCELSQLLPSSRSNAVSGSSAVSEFVKRMPQALGGLVIILRRRKWNHFSVLFIAINPPCIAWKALCLCLPHSLSLSLSYSRYRGRYMNNNDTIWQTHCNHFDEWKIVCLWSDCVIMFHVWCVWWIRHVVNSQLTKCAAASTAKWSAFAVLWKTTSSICVALHKVWTSHIKGRVTPCFTSDRALGALAAPRAILKCRHPTAHLHPSSPRSRLFLRGHNSWTGAKCKMHEG